MTMICSMRHIGLPLRALVLLALLLTTTYASAHKDRIETPRTLAVSFENGDHVTFAISDGKISAVTLHIGTADFSVPENVCAQLKDIRFDTVSLLWDGQSASAAKSGYFYLEFQMGSEKKRAFGELPQVQLMFTDGKFDGATIRKKMAQDTWQDSKLKVEQPKL
jgi:hypothetical protein